MLFSKNSSLIVLSNSLTILGFYLYHPIIIKYHKVWKSLWKSMEYWNKQQCYPLPFNQFDLELYPTCTLIFWLISPLKYHQSCGWNKKICAILYSFLKQNIEIQMFWDNKKPNMKLICVILNCGFSNNVYYFTNELAACLT